MMEKVAAFFERISIDPELKLRLKEARTPEEICRVAAQVGYEFSPALWHAFWRAMPYPQNIVHWQM